MKTRKRKQEGGSQSCLRDSYGYVILPKGFLLYRTSTSTSCEVPPGKNILFTTAHPSDWYSDDVTVTVLEVQKDIKLFFMISRIVRLRIQSALLELLEKPKINMVKMNPLTVEKWLPYLEKEGLDGWFSSIEGKTSIEFAIRNNPAILKAIQCEPIVYNWVNSYYKDDDLIPKSWGITYPICELPLTFVIPERFRQQIEDYQRMVEKEDPEGTTFSILLKYAKFKYTNKEFRPIHWAL